MRPLEPLWVIGLAILCLLVGHFIFRSPWLELVGKTYDWAQYAVAGMVFPALLFGTPLLWRWRRWPATHADAIKRLMMLGSLVAFAVFILASMVRHGVWSGSLALFLAAAQAAVMTQPWRHREIRRNHLLSILVLATVGWTVAFSSSLAWIV